MKQTVPTVWILIAAYNEADRLPAVLGDLAHAGWANVLVVDDGSTDATALQAEQHGAQVLRQTPNQGQGAALRAGIAFLSAHEQPDIIVTFDADGQHRASDIHSLVAPVAAGVADVTLGSRFLHPDSTVPWARRLTLKSGIVFTNIVSGITLTDTHNGLRALSRRAYTTIRIKHARMAHASDIIDEISVHGLRYHEVPVTILYPPRRLRKGQPSWRFIGLGLQIIAAKAKDVLAR